jgi:hypothetical protein
LIDTCFLKSSHLYATDEGADPQRLDPQRRAQLEGASAGLSKELRRAAGQKAGLFEHADVVYAEASAAHVATIFDQINGDSKLRTAAAVAHLVCVCACVCVCVRACVHACVRVWGGVLVFLHSQASIFVPVLSYQ